MRPLALALILLVAACGERVGGGRDAIDAAEPDTQVQDVAPDVGCEGVALDCQRASDEQCGACFRQIARCCYDDQDIQGMIAPLTAACEARTECLGCCDECAALGCDALRARRLCPNGVE